MFDYKINLDGVMHDYYGRKRENVELFKYNNVDYYINGSDVFSNKGTWVKSENPYIFSEFIKLENLNLIMNSASYESKTEF